MKPARALFTAVIAVLTLSSASVFALDVQIFRPQPLSSGGVSVHGPHLLSPGYIEGQFFVEWVKQPLEFRYSGTTPRTVEIVDNWWVSYYRLTYGLNSFINLSLDFPVNIRNDLDNFSGTVADNPTFGDITMSGVFRLLTHAIAEKRQASLSVIPFVTIPTGDSKEFSGEDGLTGGFRVAWGGATSEKGAVRLNAGFRFREEKKIYNLDVNHEFLFGAGYTRKLWVKHELDGFVELYGSTATRTFSADEVSSPVDLVFGVTKAWFDARLLSVLGAGAGINDGYGAPDMRVFAGVAYRYSPSRRAADETRGQVRILVKTEEGKEVPSHIKIVAKDSDATLREAPSAATLEHLLAAGQYRFEVKADGHYRKFGRFRIESRRATVIVLVLKKEFKTGKIEFVGKVLFDIDKASIKNQSHAALAEVIDVLKRYPMITKLRVEAHTDSLASDGYNIRLSNNRAKSVMAYLINEGVAEDRLTSQGFGESQPLADNNTLEGRAINRRVEFTILDMLPDDVEVEEYAPSELYNIEKAPPPTRPTTAPGPTTL